MNVAPNSNLAGWRPPPIDRESYFEAEVAAYQRTLDDIRNLPETNERNS